MPSRRDLLKCLGLAPVAVFVAPSKSHAERAAEERAANPPMVVTVPMCTPATLVDQIIADIAATGHDAIVLPEGVSVKEFGPSMLSDPAFVSAVKIHQWTREDMERMP